MDRVGISRLECVKTLPAVETVGKSIPAKGRWNAKAGTELHFLYQGRCGKNWIVLGTAYMCCSLSFSLALNLFPSPSPWDVPLLFFSSLLLFPSILPHLFLLWPPFLRDIFLNRSYIISSHTYVYYASFVHNKHHSCNSGTLIHEGLTCRFCSVVFLDLNIDEAFSKYYC